jgi:hypothetical protein
MMGGVGEVTTHFGSGGGPDPDMKEPNTSNTFSPEWDK